MVRYEKGQCCIKRDVLTDMNNFQCKSGDGVQREGASASSPPREAFSEAEVARG